MSELTEWAFTPPQARKEAAAALWAELTGRTQSTEKSAGVPTAPTDPVRDVAKSTGVGAATGAGVGMAAAGAATHVLNKRRVAEGVAHGLAATPVKQTLLRHALPGAGVAAGALGAAAGLVHGVRSVKKRFAAAEQPQAPQAKVGMSPLQKRLVGAGVVGLGSAALGGAHEYRQNRVGADGRSAHMMREEQELGRLHDLSTHLGKSGLDQSQRARLRQEYQTMRVQHAKDLAQSPGKAALMSAGLYGLAGAGTGALLGGQLPG